MESPWQIREKVREKKKPEKKVLKDTARVGEKERGAEDLLLVLLRPTGS